MLPFDKANLPIAGAKKKRVVLGNGFRIALPPEIFTYRSLYDYADLSAAPHVVGRATDDIDVGLRRLHPGGSEQAGGV